LFFGRSIGLECQPARRPQTVRLTSLMSNTRQTVGNGKPQRFLGITHHTLPADPEGLR
jgi:hypothetical protein